MARFNCPITSIEYYDSDTRRVLLGMPEGERLCFKAGQYLEVILPDKTCPYSIASAPHESGLIELHVRPTPASDDSEDVEHLLDSANHIEIEAPKGDCFIDSPPENALILLAASTGVTQMKSIVEHLFHVGHKLPMFLYWGVLSDQDLYLDTVCRQWAVENANFQYIPVVSEPETSPDWHGRTGLVGEVVLQDFDDLSDVTVYVGGGPGMVYATLDAFVARGLPRQNMYSDIFSYAPRD